VARGAPDFYSVVREKGLETRVYRRFGSLEAGGTDVLIDNPGVDTEVVFLEFATDFRYSELILRPYKSDGTKDYPIIVTTSDGIGISMVTPYGIREEESIMWYELIYDTTKNHYKFGLGYPVRFSNGLYLAVSNTDPVASHNIGCLVIVQIRG